MSESALAAWFARGRLTEAQYGALVQWRDDGGGIRRQKRRQSPQEGRQREEKAVPDLMSQAARWRHKRALQDVERIAGEVAARSLHRLAMCDDGDQRVDQVQRGASVVWCWYSGA